MAKNIPAVTIGNETYEIKDLTAREHLVEVKPGNTPPTSPDNKLWIKDEQRTFEVPTMEEFNEQNKRRLPIAPTTNGVYRLKCTVNNGTVTYTWEPEN